eukprot:TRINITY_DN3988_c0_g1_i1.p3 TRINITY_DN3988_c0_g1~~TRINITY_DN3988_c0_g1_i1.p3  ORF type:complete len:154 (-),score=31.57 TRINITY_DN3988_c0_g1_i1:323-784(-)
MQLRLPNTTVTRSTLRNPRVVTYGNRNRKLQGGVWCCQETITKKVIAAQVSEDLGNLSQKAVAEVITNTLKEIMEEVAAGNKVVFPGFGSFESRKRSARKGVNPKTQEPMDIPESMGVGFKAGKTFKDLVKNGGGEFDEDEEEEEVVSKSKKK